MVMGEFYENLKQSLESDFFTELILSKGDINSDARRLFLVKSLYFLISTRDFDGFEEFLSHYYKDVFPYEYLRKKLICLMAKLKEWYMIILLRMDFYFMLLQVEMLIVF